MTSLYMVITNFDDTATTDSDISFNYGTSLNPNGNINLTGTLPSAPGVSNFYSGVSFPNDLPGIDQTIGDVYLCFGGTSMETINNSNRIEGKMLKGSETNTTRKFAFTSPNIHSNLGSSLGQFGSCVSAGVDYDFYDKNLGGLPYRVRIETTPKIANWVAVGDSNDPAGLGGSGSAYGNIMFSVDGISWQTSNTGASFSDAGYGVAYGNNMWVAVGDNNTPLGGGGPGSPYGNILYSTDGLSWKPSTTGASFSSAGLGVAYSSSQNRWVAVGDNDTPAGGGGTGSPYGNILYSDDGISWQPSNTGASFAKGGIGVAYSQSQNRWVAVGSSDISNYYNCILHSPDGISWHPSNTGASFRGGAGHGVAYSSSQNRWVAVGDNDTGYGNILHSTDGISWHPSNTGASFSGQGHGVAYSSSQNRWVAVGYNDTGYGNILHSTDGISWHPSNTGASFSGQGHGVAYSSSQNRWVAVGDNNTPTGGGTGSPYGNILHSTDGISWYQTTEFSAFPTSGSGVAFKI